MAAGITLPGQQKQPSTAPAYQTQPQAKQPAVGSDYQSQVKQFQQNVPQYENQLFQTATNQARNNLAGQMADIRQNAASRGLLYGGLRQGAEDQARAQTAGQRQQDFSPVPDHDVPGIGARL